MAIRESREAEEEMRHVAGVSEKLKRGNMQVLNGSARLISQNLDNQAHIAYTSNKNMTNHPLNPLAPIQLSSATKLPEQNLSNNAS